jgi:hypothetical protein
VQPSRVLPPPPPVRASDIKPGPQTCRRLSLPVSVPATSRRYSRLCTTVPKRARAMTTFAPTASQPPASSAPGDTPHHNPPPPHVQHGPFAHQLHPPPASAFTSNNPPQVSRRASRDLRHHASNGAMANGNGPMAVPGGRMANGHAHGGHGQNQRDMAFAGPRSPPNNKSRPWHSSQRRVQRLTAPRYIPRALQVLPARHLPGGKSLPVPALGRAADRTRSLQVLH